MKNFKRLISIALVILLFACEKNDDLNSRDVSGTYVGTITGDFKSSESATTTVINIGDQIEIHCYSENFNTTIRLDVYDSEGNVMVCLTGEDFEDMYGHMMGEGNMPHNGTEWMQHLNNDHQEDDEHFGFFNMQHQFDFTFQMSDGDFHFQGTKN